MNITMKETASHRISSSKSMKFLSGRTYLKVTKKIGDALIARDVARLATPEEVAQKEKSQKEGS